MSYLIYRREVCSIVNCVSLVFSTLVRDGFQEGVIQRNCLWITRSGLAIKEILRKRRWVSAIPCHVDNHNGIILLANKFD